MGIGTLGFAKAEGCERRKFAKCYPAVLSSSTAHELAVLTQFLKIGVLNSAARITLISTLFERAQSAIATRCTQSRGVASTNRIGFLFAMMSPFLLFGN